MIEAADLCKDQVLVCLEGEGGGGLASDNNLKFRIILQIKNCLFKNYEMI